MLSQDVNLDDLIAAVRADDHVVARRSKLAFNLGQVIKSCYKPGATGEWPDWFNEIVTAVTKSLELSDEEADTFRFLIVEYADSDW